MPFMEAAEVPIILQDLAQMRSIAKTGSYHCLEPVLLIVGRPSESEWPLYTAVITATAAVTLRPSDGK